jgi:hypothetical protein
MTIEIKAAETAICQLRAGPNAKNSLIINATAKKKK